MLIEIQFENRRASASLAPKAMSGKESSPKDTAYHSIVESYYDYSRIVVTHLWIFSSKRCDGTGNPRHLQGSPCRSSLSLVAAAGWIDLGKDGKRPFM